jgi:hypothetical protein
METGLWRVGPAIPGFDLWGTTIQLERTFLIVGGIYLGNEVNNIWYFDENDYVFVEKEQRLATPKSRTGAVMLPQAISDRFTC